MSNIYGSPMVFGNHISGLHAPETSDPITESVRNGPNRAQTEAEEEGQVTNPKWGSQSEWS